jgi:hypothetical protein
METSSGDVANGLRTNFASAASHFARGRVRMKCAMVAFLIIALAATTVTVAQDGSGHGPPDKRTIVGPVPAPQPGTVLPKIPLPTRR